MPSKMTAYMKIDILSCLYVYKEVSNIQVYIFQILQFTYLHVSIVWCIPPHLYFRLNRDYPFFPSFIWTVHHWHNKEKWRCSAKEMTRVITLAWQHDNLTNKNIQIHLASYIVKYEFSGCHKGFIRNSEIQIFLAKHF